MLRPRGTKTLKSLLGVAGALMVSVGAAGCLGSESSQSSVSQAAQETAASEPIAQPVVEGLPVGERASRPSDADLLPSHGSH
jgi:hypothetical protein